MCYTFVRTNRKGDPVARPRNEELFQSIKKEAYHQLMSYGYTDTTYQSIASACGVTRAAVQNYYASKPDLALAFFGDLLEVIQKTVIEKHMHEENEFDTMFCIGQSFFAFLLQDNESRKLLLDMATSREITSQVLAFEYAWGLRFIAHERTVSEETFRDDVIVSMGGYYELLYNCLKDDRAFDMPVHLGRVIRTIMHDHGYSYDDAKAFVASHTMTSDEFDTVIADVAKRMEL